MIGISANYQEDQNSYFLREDYCSSILKAGGIPLIIPPFQDLSLIDYYLNICSAVLFSGGGDIDPYYWGETADKELGIISPERDLFELDLCLKAISLKIPILGICRGCQLLNVATGGNIIQHITSSMCHTQKAPRNYPIHDIFIFKESLLYRIMQQEYIRVNSFHHQAVKIPGDKLYISAQAADGTIEAIEFSAAPFVIGVQWHPECMHDSNSFLLFKAFVNAANEYRHPRMG